MVTFDQDYPIIVKFPFLQPDCTDSRLSERMLIDGIFTNYIQNRKVSTCVGAYLENICISVSPVRITVTIRASGSSLPGDMV